MPRSRASARSPRSGRTGSPAEDRSPGRPQGPGSGRQVGRSKADAADRAGSHEGPPTGPGRAALGSGQPGPDPSAAQVICGVAAKSPAPNVGTYS